MDKIVDGWSGFLSVVRSVPYLGGLALVVGFGFV